MSNESDLSSALIVIESPTKIKWLKQHLPNGFEFAATFGHLFKSPDSLEPLCVNKDYEDTAMEPRNREVLNFLKDRVIKHDYIIIATDPDEEGDRIAYDVKMVCARLGKDNISRSHILEMNQAGIMRAINERTPGLVANLEFKASRRRTVDRMIGAGLKHCGSRGGRVTSAIIKHLASSGMSERCTVSAFTSQKGFEGFVNQADAAWTGVETVFHCANALDRSPVDVAQDMQSLFEQGKLSYPRANTDRVCAAAALAYPSLASKIDRRTHRLASIAVRAKRERDQGDKMKSTSTGSRRDDSHASPYPLRQAPQGNPKMMSGEDAVLSIIEKKWSGEKVRYSRVRSDAGLMAVGAHLKVGTASTLPGIATSLVDKGVVFDGELALTPKGHEWFKSIPSCMVDSDISERLMQDDDASAEQIMIEAGLSLLVEPLLNDENTIDFESVVDDALGVTADLEAPLRVQLC